MHRFKRRPSPATVIAVIALVAAATGTAAAKTLITGLNIKDGTVTGRDIKAHTITARNLSRTIKLAPTGGVGPVGPAGAAGADGLNGVDGKVTSSDAKPNFPQQVTCRLVAFDDQDDSGRGMVNLNEQQTLEMYRIITITPTQDPTVEVNCWQPKRTGKGDGVVITGARVLLLRVNEGVDLNPAAGAPPATIPNPGAASTAIQELHFNNTDERKLIKGTFQDTNDAIANGVPNPTNDQLATNIVNFKLTPPAGTTTNTRYMVWARVRTDKVRRSTDLDKTGAPTKQAPHVLADEDAEPLQSPTILP